LDADNSQAKCILLSGAYGKYEDFVNGAYEPTSVQPIRYGRMRYRKLGHSHILIEHHKSFWCVKNEADKDAQTICAKVAGDCALESCEFSTWELRLGSNSTDETCISMQLVDKVTMFSK
jgi:hypothetical protein